MFNLFQYGWFHNAGAIAVFVLWIAAFLSISIKKKRLEAAIVNMPWRKERDNAIFQCSRTQTYLVGVLALILAIIFF